MLENIKWLGHASFRIDGEKVIYIDPWNVKEAKLADLILVTHEHYDHCSPKDIKKIQKKETAVVTVSNCAGKLSGEVKVMNPGDSLTVSDIEVEAVPAYNLKKPFHPEANGWIGFVFTVAGKRIYHAGDTDLIPEMEGIKADIVLLPIGGTYTMDAKEAAEAANKIKPEIAIPMHYGSIVGSIKDAEQFKELCQVRVEILPAE